MGHIIVTLAIVPRLLQWLSVVASRDIKNILASLAIQQQKI
jgi:hypothetical protein